MTKKEVTEKTLEAFEASKQYWNELKAKNKLPQESRRFFSDSTAAMLADIRELIDNGEVEPERMLPVLLGAAVTLQTMYVDKVPNKFRK